MQWWGQQQIDILILHEELLKKVSEVGPNEIQNIAKQIPPCLNAEE